MSKYHTAAMIVALLAAAFPGAAAAPKQKAEDAQVQPLRIIRTQELVYPVRLIKDGILHGEARIAFHIDENGRLMDSMAVAYTAREFAESALDALQSWKFVPSRVGEKRFSNVVHLTVIYENNGTVAIVRDPIPSTDANPNAPAGTYLYQPCAPALLDSPLKLSQVAPPDYPNDLRRQGVEGRVRVNFYVDERGKPRMVVANAEADPRLAGLAIYAVESWRFVPPTRKGKPVLVSVSQEFSFVAAEKPRGDGA